MQVARLIAGQDPHAPGTFAHAPFIWATAALMGTPAKAALTQIQNLSADRKADLKKARDAILTIKPYRDAIAHSLSGPSDEGKTQFHGFGASRVRMGTDKFYTVEQMDGWCHELKTRAREIDTIVTDVIGWKWKNIDEDRQRWLAGLPRPGE